MREREINFRDVGRIAMWLATCCGVLLLIAVAMLAAPAISSAGVAVGVSVTLAPPALPVYVQPLCPGPGYIWTPGYWAWDPDFGYYWVPGTWVLTPFVGALWTPGYWDWDDGVFVWIDGYWGPVVGFYGGIDYGFGYTGFGYEGGYWRGGTFYYNRAVNNVSVTNITNVYSKTVSGPVTTTQVSYHGGHGGTTLRPTAAQLAAARERHSGPTDVQRRQERVARADPKQRAAVNHGRPSVAATQKPGVLTGRNVVPARRAGAPYKTAPSGRIAGPNAPARTPHAGGTERRPRVTAPEQAAPHARPERHAAPRREPQRPAYRPGEPRHAPENAAPHARVERPAAPRRETARPAYRPVEPRPAPERPGVAVPPNTHRAEPQRPEEPRPPKGNARPEEGRPR